MPKHHIVQDKYLTQWRKADKENQLNIYLIPDNKYIERGPGWKKFWRDNFNILDEDQEKFYLPENVTALIDTKGIEVVRSIDCVNKKQLYGKDDRDRCYLAFYIALQYIRTPRHREEMDKFVDATIKHFIRQDVSTSDKIGISKKEILKHCLANKCKEEALKKVSTMSDKEIKKQIFESLHSDDFGVCLTNTGHSKEIFKIDQLAKKLFEIQWFFLVAPKGTFFATSDNPCFTISSTKIGQGPLSPHAITFFPLRPDLCIAIKSCVKSQKENFLKLNKKKVKEINQLILSNSYQCFIAKDKKQLENLTKDFDYENHHKSRGVATYKIGDYVMFNVE